MTRAQILPSSLNVFHGMQHVGLTGEALQIERSVAFKKAFSETITVDLGFDERQFDMKTAADSDREGLEPHHTRFNEAFGPDGHPPLDEIRIFLNAEISRSRSTAVETSDRIEAGVETMDCCIRILGGWYDCSGYSLLRCGRPWKIEAAVARYEEIEGAINDADVRRALSSIEVMAQVAWKIEFL